MKKELKWLLRLSHLAADLTDRVWTQGAQSSATVGQNMTWNAANKEFSK